MSDYKIVHRFVTGGNKTRSFGEIFYAQAPTLGNVASNYQGVTAIVNHRLLLLHKLNLWTKTIISEVGSPRVSVIIPVNRYGLAGGPGNGGGPEEFNTAVVVNLVSLVKPSRRFWWLRGGADEDAFQDAVTGNDVFDPRLQGSINQFLQAATGANFQIMPNERTDIWDWQTIASITPIVGLPQSTVVTTMVHGFVQGDTVTFGRPMLKDLPGLRGRFTVVSRGVNTAFDINYVTPSRSTFVNVTARVRKLSPISGAFIDPTSSGPAFIASRKTKSPNTGGRGARSAARGLRLQA